MKKIFLLALTSLFALTGCNNEEKHNSEEEPVVPVEPVVEESEVVKRAKAELGKPYAWGAVGPDNYDASGFVCYCLTGEHSRFATTTTFMNYPVAETPTAGDICVNAYNCGIYIEEGKMIFAAGFGDVVRYGDIESTMIVVKYPGNN